MQVGGELVSEDAMQTSLVYGSESGTRAMIHFENTHLANLVMSLWNCPPLSVHFLRTHFCVKAGHLAV